MIYLVNIIIALFLLYAGGNLVAIAIASFILEHTDAEILAKVRELRNISEE